MDEGKRCCKCEAVRLLSEFGRMTTALDGLQSMCKPCFREYDRAYRVANRERLDAKRAVRHKADPERIAAKQRRWSQKYPEKRSAIGRRRRARLRAAIVGEVDYGALWTGACALCGGDLDATLCYPDPMSKSVDHIVPLARGGTHTQVNLQWTHLVCNVRKGARVA